MSTLAAASAPQAGSARITSWRLLANNRLATAGLVLLGTILLLTALAPILPLPDPNATAPADRLKPVLTAGHLLGTDQLGRDILSRLLWGTRVSVAVGFAATFIAAGIGSAIGIVAGYAGGRIDNAMMRGIDMLMAFPYILLALAIVAALGPGLMNALYAIALVNIPFFARNVRGVTLGYAHREFVDAARLSGKGNLSIILTEVLPNVMPVIVITMSTTAGWMILETAGLSFLGLGAQPPQADLGSMLGEGRAQLFTAPHVSIVPGVMIFLIVISLNVLGDGIRDVLDPRLRSGALARPGPVTEVARDRTAPASTADDAVLVIEKLETGFRQGGEFIPAVRGVSLHVKPGECLGLIGESGSGKSVTALSVMGLVASPPGVIRNGAVYVGNEDVLSMPETRLIAKRGSRVAYVFQDPLTTLHPMVAIGRQVEESIAAHQAISAADCRKKAIELLEKVGIPDARARSVHYPHQLSGGQRQRVGIAMALANDPEIIIADEPTTALDVTVQARILELLRDLQRERGMALLFITHDFGIVSEFCDRVAVMKDGEIVETGETRQVLADPQHAYTKRLIACVPELGTGAGFLDRVATLFAEDKKEVA
ncbi:dipeptide/oligopeptide/nickel ABC transporter permease/ATP-binding protein [Sinorhizobium medicae]|uniref:dipeptide/oligopeptide/nickel ABC transporter permease/ATP-binding protein n=1 Tax=Sinorhizobium medicae TaxID=110321 RepID=UPI000C7D3A77|nr:dipeptide/oligopeptide/nickel ABC transporter permease/ATP-binding protein [Sinorhizobium medicae]MDX0499920.1 ABC transporter permease subunit [Sinorhizobium medicae]MDX0573959.1 ABC transporter permease subunit [Sinorhizobium medicae]MDX0672757.1 ABC transporter permease subunit [Sinorhizobium medicae]MDX0710018.1 ABC transporter permease subunit [Sinorhizobium medicae]MDX0887800.1 ABC transporter permease subunit [Sinorhizobium medicae]